MTADTLQLFRVKGSKVKFTAWYNRRHKLLL